MTNDLFLKMKDFYDTSPLALKLAQPLKEGAVGEIQFEGDPESYTLIKEGGRSVLKIGKPKKPEVFMKYSRSAVEYLFELHQQKNYDIQEWMNRFSECILHPTPERKIEFKVCANLVTVARMGYFGMLKLGGKRAFDLALEFGVKIPKKFLASSAPRVRGAAKAGKNL